MMARNVRFQVFGSAEEAELVRREADRLGMSDSELLGRWCFGRWQADPVFVMQDLLLSLLVEILAQSMDGNLKSGEQIRELGKAEREKALRVRGEQLRLGEVEAMERLRVEAENQGATVEELVEKFLGEVKK